VNSSLPPPTLSLSPLPPPRPSLACQRLLGRRSG
jgi:hypothetical protein